MRQDVIDALSGRYPASTPSKESLNHPGIISHVSGMDAFDHTPAAFELAWRKLGIDIHVAKPEHNASRPEVPGGTWVKGNKLYADMGVYPTSMPLEYCPEISKSEDDWVFKHDACRDDFDFSQKLSGLKSANDRFRSDFGNQAVMYHLYYTTLFMWPVVKFDWEPFMLAAISQPELFNETLWQPWARISRKNFEVLAAMGEDVVFCHDDLTMSTGPVFPPEFYEKYIFSQYDYIFEPVVKAGKKLVFVCDGNMDIFLERLLEFPIDGIMFENPATPFERVLDTWGRAERGFIGGIETNILTCGTPDEVREHTRSVIEKGREYPGFIISSCGGLHGNIPMENMLAYFAARNAMGISAELE